MREVYDFCLKMDFDKTADRPERIFDRISEMIRSLQALDQTLILCVSGEIKPVLMLEDIESGSIKVWLRQCLLEIPDEAIKDGEIKKVIGHFLVKGKAAIIRFIDKRDTISDREELGQLEQAITAEAIASSASQLACYHNPNREKLLAGMQQLSEVMSNLGENDRMSFIDDQGAVLNINRSFRISDDVVQSLVVRETLTSDVEMILMVKQPDYLGEAQWKFRHGNKIIDAKVLDAHWLKAFQDRRVDLRPGDSVRAKVRTTAFYGYNNELVHDKHEIIAVLEVIAGEFPLQMNLLT